MREAKRSHTGGMTRLCDKAGRKNNRRDCPMFSWWSNNVCGGQQMKKILYHGSGSIIEIPIFGAGNPRNDYGLGFYCTANIELAKEWSCSDANGGFANEYSLITDDLNILNLSSPSFGILNWLALLTDHRTFRLTNRIAMQGRDYLQAYFLPEISGYDAISGYRADDSYFAFAQDFLSNTISLEQLQRAMYLGELGEQFVLKSRRAFDLLTFERSEIADGSVYFEKRMVRDAGARRSYLKSERDNVRPSDDLYLIDIIRQEMKHDDERLR
jgi:hypothetical protein